MHPIIASAPLTPPETVVAIPEDVREKRPTRVACDGVDGGLRSSIGQQDRGEKYGQDGMNRGAVREAGVDGVDGGVRSGPGQEARVEKPGQDAMNSASPGACPGGGEARAAGLDGGAQSGLGPYAMG